MKKYIRSAIKSLKKIDVSIVIALLSVVISTFSYSATQKNSIYNERTYNRELFDDITYSFSENYSKLTRCDIESYSSPTVRNYYGILRTQYIENEKMSEALEKEYSAYLEAENKRQELCFSLNKKTTDAELRAVVDALQALSHKLQHSYQKNVICLMADELNEKPIECRSI